jgi:hypothetical protein
MLAKKDGEKRNMPLYKICRRLNESFCLESMLEIKILIKISKIYLK